MSFLQELRRQRWDDHRYYHHNRVNQALHFLSSICFLASYALLFIEPAAAVFIGWLLAMTLRQTGHFFFEPKTFDEVNSATHDYKESVKVGYNLFRKIILLSVWGLATLAVAIDPTLLGLLGPVTGTAAFLDRLAFVWLAIGLGAVVFRTFHLFHLMGVQSGLVWCTKILTDPFHDFKIYRHAPALVLRGDLYDDMSQWYDPSVLADRS